MRDWLDRAWPSLVALAGTVGVVVALLVLFGDNTGDNAAEDVAAGEQDGGGASNDAATGQPEPTGGSTGGTSNDDPTGDATTGAEGGGEGGSGEEPSNQSTTAPPELRSPVGIANQTSVEDLELVAKQRLEEGGWEVPATSGFTGNVPETTVYYPPGMEEYAEALSRQFPEIGRVEDTFEGVNQNRLVVVLVEDYLDSIEDE